MRRAVAALAGAAATALTARAAAVALRRNAGHGDEPGGTLADSPGGPDGTDSTGSPDNAGSLDSAGSPGATPAGWQRTNYRGRTVSLSGGLAAAVGTTAAAAAAGGSARTAVAAALATAGAATFGLIDDRDRDPTHARGLRGHLRALTRGQVTTGTLKLVGIPTLALVAAAAMDRGTARPAGHPLRRGVDVLTAGALIAGSANLINLFDLRPGRALKATGMIAAPLAVLPGPAGRLGAGATGVVAAAWADDLAERTMLGDTGANALGALVGTGLALVPFAGVRAAALTGVVALIVLSEKVSFSAVIDRTPLARAVDRWGRLP